MISIEDGIFHKLTNDAGVKVIVIKRVYPLILPPTPIFPAITYQLITPMNITTHDGTTGTAYPRFQITGWSMDYEDTRDLMKKVRICMSGFKGTFGAGANTVNVQAVLPAGGSETFEPETQRYMRWQDYVIWHNEDIT